MIHYFMIWGENPLGRKLAYSPAGLNKAKYILEKLCLADNTKVASFASGGTAYYGLYRPKSVSINGIDFFYCGTYGHSLSVFRRVERILNIIQMYLYILLHTKKNDILVFYNERYFSHAIKFAHKYLKRKVIVEVEEINCVAANYPQKYIDHEINNMKYADGYILVNNILPEYMPFVLEKPHCYIYGAYNSIDIDSPTFSDGKFHVLYSGTYNATKGGVFAAISLATALPNRYHIHITGFGNNNEIEAVERELNNLDTQNRSKITYHGFLPLSDLDTLMNKCHIGLCTQDPSTQLNLTSFPSKIINYMAHGLLVLSGRNRAIESSDVGDLICYYDKQTPSDMAKSIESMTNFDTKQCKKRILDLDNKAAKNIASMVENIRHLSR